MATITGQVLTTGSNAQPIKNVLVTCQFQGGNTSTASMTNADGKYTLYNVDLSMPFLLTFTHQLYQTRTVYLEADDSSQATYTYNITLSPLQVNSTTTSSDEEEEESLQYPPPLRDGFYSGANARVYIYGRPGGQQMVELDIVTINFTYQYPKLPLYGYKSTFMDDVAVGSVLVQGSFTLNMQQSFYLQQFIKESLEPNFNYVYNHQPVQYRNDQFISFLPKNMNPIFQKAIPPIRVDIDLIYNIDFSNLYSANTGYHIRSAQITDMSQVVTQTGEPVGENYTFLARSLEPISLTGE